MYKEWRKLGFHIGFGATIGVCVGKMVIDVALAFGDHIAEKLINADTVGNPDIDPDNTATVPETETK